MISREMMKISRKNAIDQQRIVSSYSFQFDSREFVLISRKLYTFCELQLRVENIPKITGVGRPNTSTEPRFLSVHSLFDSFKCRFPFFIHIKMLITNLSTKVYVARVWLAAVHVLGECRIRTRDPWLFTFVDKFVINSANITSRDVRRVDNKLINKRKTESFPLCCRSTGFVRVF